MLLPFPPFQDRRFPRGEAKRDGSAALLTVKSFVRGRVSRRLCVSTSLTCEADVPLRPDVDCIRGGQPVVPLG